MRTLGRRGVSLVEMLVALALFGIVGAATLRALDRQARFHTGILAILEARAQHAAAHEAVAVELRGVSSVAGDVGSLSDSAVVFRLPVGAGVVCDTAAGVMDLAPDSVSAGQAFARFRTSPQAGDSVWVFSEGVTDLEADDSWFALRITSVNRSTGRCTSSPLVDPVLDAGLANWRIAYASAVAPPIAPGAAVRLTRQARFALYRSGTESWLGYTERNPATGAWVTIQPVSGPYLPFSASAPSTSGVALQGHDSSGAISSALPFTITLATRTRTTNALRMDGVARGRYADSLRSLISVRNAR